jgi:membrane-associated phospholipid phosphatase
MAIDEPSSLHFWHLLTRLGEAQILLPAALLAAVTLLRRPGARSLAVWWMTLLCAAVVVTTASKVAFIGWGIGWPELNFTGISGHAMFAAAVYPLLLVSLASHAPPPGRRLAVAAGSAMALLVGVSRVAVGAHSTSEVLAGLLMGGTVSAVALAHGRLPRALINPAIPAAVGLWLVFMPGHAPASQTHPAVTRLSLMLSGHKVPYTRSDMMRKLRSRQSVPGGPPALGPSAGALLDVWPVDIAAGYVICCCAAEDFERVENFDPSGQT